MCSTLNSYHSIPFFDSFFCYFEGWGHSRGGVWLFDWYLVSMQVKEFSLVFAYKRFFSIGFGWFVTVFFRIDSKTQDEVKVGK